MKTHAIPYGAATTWVVWANSQFATVAFLSVFFVPLSTGRIAGPILTIYKSYNVFSPKDVPLDGLFDFVPRFGVKFSQKGHG